MSNQNPRTELLESANLTEEGATLWSFGVVSLRVALGWVFFYSGITKLLDPSWSAEGYLLHAIPEGNPFVGIWPHLVGLPFVDVLVQWGLTLTGVGLILGAFVRWNAFWASVMMVTFWASSLPLEHNLLVDEHVVYVLALFSLSVVGAGRIGGIDKYLESSSTVRNNRWLRYLLG